MSFKRLPRASAVCAAALLAVAAAPAIAADAAAPSRVMVAQRVIESAAAYQGFVSRAGAIKGDFANGEGVRSALYTAAAYQQDQLQEGAIAYAALAAMQDAKFVNSVRGYAGFPARATSSPNGWPPAPTRSSTYPRRKPRPCASPPCCASRETGSSPPARR